MARVRPEVVNSLLLVAETLQTKPVVAKPNSSDQVLKFMKHVAPKIDSEDELAEEAAQEFDLFDQKLDVPAWVTSLAKEVWEAKSANLLVAEKRVGPSQGLYNFQKAYYDEGMLAKMNKFVGMLNSLTIEPTLTQEEKKQCDQAFKALVKANQLMGEIYKMDSGH